MLTAKNTFKSQITGLGSGADSYIEKAFDMEHLQVQIASLLTNRNKLKEYFAKSPVAHLKTVAQSEPDETFLDELNEVIQTHLEDQEPDVDKLAS